MINESRESFTEWLVKTYRELHEELFDAEGKFKMERMLSGEMLCYAIVKPWYNRVRSSEYLFEDADIRQEVNEEQVRDVREFLKCRTEDDRSYLARWFLPREGEDASEVDWALMEPIIIFGCLEWFQWVREKFPDKSNEELADFMSKQLDSASFDFFEDIIWFAMDYVDRCNRDGKEIPEELRVVARLLESREEPYQS